MTRIIYPSLQQPVPVVAQGTAVYPGSWFQVPSTPIVRQVLTAAVVASGVFVPQLPVVPPPSAWAQPPSAPVLRKPTLPTSSQSAAHFVKAAPFPENVSIDRWQLPLSEPVRFKRSLSVASQQAAAYVYPASSAETILVDKWYREFSIPVRLNRLATAQHQTLAPFQENVSVDRWAQPASAPIPFKRFAANLQQSAAFVYNPVSATTIFADSWFRELSLPIARSRLSAAQYSASTYLTLFRSVIPTLALAGAPISSPPIARYQYSPSETVLADKWYRETSLPSRYAPALSTASQQAIAFVKASPFPENVSIDRWLLPLSEPVKTARCLSVASQQAVALPLPEGITADRWAQPSSTSRAFTQFAANLQQALAFVYTPPSAEVVFADKWYRETSLPIRVSPRLATASQQSRPFPENVSLDRWLLPLGEPTRFKASLGIASQQVTAFVYLPPSTLTSTGTINGTVTIFAVGTGSGSSSGAIDGSVVISGVGATQAAASASADGLSALSGASVTALLTAGAANGVASVAGVGQGPNTVGTASVAGQAAISGVGQALYTSGAANINGSCTVAGTNSSVAASSAQINGYATVNGRGPSSLMAGLIDYNTGLGEGKALQIFNKDGSVTLRLTS